ncbi:MAG: hypothetical protein H6807_10105 [Planctomycetes bacterium]|nr:hypothetical protein [Planctomycetota bacterium]
MMKNQTLDRFSRIGRLRQRLDEILHQVASRDLPRMDGGDLIGQQIVAAVEALGQRNDEENHLLFDAHRERARLFNESSGATVLEAAEALIAAHAIARELPENVREIRDLAATARTVLDGLRQVGSRRNSWACLEILMAELEVSGGADSEALVSDYVEASRALIFDGRDDGVLTAVMRHCEWARSRLPSGFRLLADLLPLIIEQGLETMPSGALLRAYLYARSLALQVAAPLLEGLVRRLAARDRVDAEARAVYQDLLVNDPEARGRLEDVFAELAYVNPGVDLAYDADRDSLNMLLGEYFSERVWVWRNRALLLRRRGDGVGALAHLARAMSISGQPPEIMAILAPVVAGLGFTQSAHQFARFADPVLREQFHLDVLDLLDAHPRSDIGRVRLQKHLDRALQRPELPVEFRKLIAARGAELLFEAGAHDEATEAYTALFRDDLSDEIAAVRLAEMAFLRGDRRRVENFLSGRFSSRVQPFALDLRSRLAEQDGDWARAAMFNAQALQAIPEAQASGRHDKDRVLALLADRIRALHGPHYVDSALPVMLQVETHAPPHADLVSLEDRLEQRRFELDARSSDHVTVSQAVVELARRDRADTDVFLTGIRKSLAGGDLARAQELVELAVQDDHGESPAIRRMRGLVALRQGALDEARAALDAAQEEEPTIEGCRLRAMVEIEAGDEAAAVVLLARAASIVDADDDGLHRCHALRGLLLERLGRVKEAYEAHLAAVALSADWNESRRRAGLLGLDQAFDGDGRLRDRVAAYKALDLLDGFHDGESVLRSAIARSRLEENSDRAVTELEAALRRLAGAQLDRLRRELLARLLELGRLDDAADVADHLLEATDCPDREQLGRIRAAALRRRALENLARVTGRDSRAERSAFEALDEADRLDPSGATAPLTAILRHALVEDQSEPPLGRNPDPALAVAVALAGGQRRKDGSVRTAVQRAVGVEDEGVARAAGLVAALSSGKARDLLQAIEDLDQAAFSLPWSRIDTLRIAAAKALQDDDQLTLDEILGRAPGRFPDLVLYRELLAASTSDCARLMPMIEDLRRALGDRLELPEDSLRALRMRVTALRETPSEAWASSRLRVAGKRTRTWDAAALDFWVGRIDDDESGVALHHVALMELARAHELEVDQRCGFDHWRRVHDLWSRLLVHDRFWKDLEWSADAEVIEAVSSVREQIGGWLLLAQLRLAKRRMFAGDLARAIEHARLTVSSPLMRHCDSGKVREILFDALSGELEKHLQRKRYDEALAAIDHVIVADRDNPLARQEMVRVAGMALQPALATMDALSSPADPGMIAETCDMLGRVLVLAQDSILVLGQRPPQDPNVAAALVTCLRGMAYIARHRDDDVGLAAEYLQHAVAVAEACGLPTSSLRKLHSELGLEVVRRTIAETPTRAHELGAIEDDNPFGKALDEVDRLLEIDPDNVNVITQKARLLLAAERDDEAEALARDLFARARESRETSSVRLSVELLHQVQSEREKLRYESRMEMIDRLIGQRNWRVALDVFRETTVGRESESRHVLLHADLLLALRRFDKAEVAIAQLADCEGMESEWRSRFARLQMLRAMAARGGDVLSAYELIERGEHERALAIIKDLFARDDRDPLHHYLAAACHGAAGRLRQAEDHGRAACRNGRGHDWLRVALEDLETER